MIPKWYSSFHVYIDLRNEMVNVYDKAIKKTLEEGFKAPFKVVFPIINIAVIISRIVPFRIDEDNKAAIITEKENIDYLTEYLPFIGFDLRKIIFTHNDLLFRLGALRNKYEHVPHFVDEVSAGGAVDKVDVTFKLPNRRNNLLYEININSSEIFKLITDINNMIIKVIKYILDDIKKNYIEFLGHPYYSWLTRNK